MNEFAKSVCVLIFVCVIFENLSPKGSFEKIYKYVLSMIFVFSLLIFTSEIIKSDFSFENIEKISPMSFETLDDEIIKAAKQNIENLAASKLISENIEYKNIDVKMDITENGSINIDRVTVYLTSYEDALLAKYAIEEALSIKTEVILNEG